MTPGMLLLPVAIAWPLVLAALIAVPALRRAAVLLAPTAALPALALAVLPAAAPVDLRAPGLFTSMALGVDPTGRPFLLLTALLWSIVGFHAAAYMRGKPRRSAFTAFMLLTATGNIGLTVTQDALSFYLFFTLMTFAAYGLVVHSRTPEALRAGRVYIAMAVLGEGLLLAGLFAITAFATDATFAQVPDAWARLQHPEQVAFALLFGFGVKAGMLPVHLWLPLAHPVAPTPASALLSGAMIKAGVLGWLRFLPGGVFELTAAGTAALMLGVAATIVGAIVGVTQRDAKTVLAYSSISQMGFITAGVGALLLVPAAAPLLTLAIAVYALHHALAKAALFLSVGLVPALDRAGLRSRWPWVLAAALPALVLAGAPLTSGAIAKSALKTALGDLPAPWSGRIDLVLSIAAIGTTLLMARFLAVLPATTAGHESSRRDATHADAMSSPHGATHADAASSPHNTAHADATSSQYSATHDATTTSQASAHDHAVTTSPTSGPDNAARPAAGLMVPWLLLVLLSVLAGIWLPLALASPQELPLAVAPGYIAAALWPIALGCLLAAASFGLHRRFPALTTAAVPAGDIIALLEVAWRRLRGLAARGATHVPGGLGESFERAASRAGRTIDRTAAQIENISTGPALGAVLCLIVVMLLLALR